MHPSATALRLAVCATLMLAAPLRAEPAAAAPPAAAAKTAVLPGDDFFDYVNGDWLDSVEIPADRSGWGVGNALIEDTNQRLLKLIEAMAAQPADAEAKKIADFYASFMDEAGIEAKGLAPLQPLLQQIAAIRDKGELAKALGGTLRADVDPLNATNFFTENLFGLWIAQGLKDSEHYTPYLLQGGLGMPDRAYYLDHTPAMKKLRGQYLAHIAATFRLAGIADADARAARVFELERRIAMAHASREVSSDVLKANNNWSAADFARKAPGLDWKAFFASAGLGGQKKFIVWHPGAVAGAAKLVQSVPLETWKDFLAFHSVNHVSSALPKALAEQHFDFYGRTLNGTPQQSLRWKRSLNAVNMAMPDALGKVYVAKYFPPESKQRLQQMVGKIVDAFHARIDQLAWMAPATKLEAHAKLKTLYVGIGYPDKWASYEQLEVAQDDALGNLLRAERVHTQQQLAKLRQPVDRGEWCMPAQLVNAVNMPMQNAINFPAAILQAPYFDPQASDAVNYGSIGATIGHEISHSFDDQGAQFDSRGLLRDWWTAADGKHFKRASAALAAQYSAYKPFPDLAINGQQTLSENLADLAGLAASHDAYRATLARQSVTAEADQPFFIGYAMSWREKAREAALRRAILTDGHAPDKWRTATVRNMDAWYQAFNVQPGQTLYLAPKDRVRVW
ncbi:neutral endopeptidase PepO [Janthinobacterium sp. HH01]|uniref:M13 family metallopeptidase n=1 Tax=Janthinobacterium sp. HH01 TaxID=1198452 RepID=UPI0002AE8DCC|nr:M13 family metallopeptidase [Janthinobacterium sp. HH01]ELX13123.1 neutral endopeptidase PepO [Janthinobacterium sp. HH01]